MYLLTSGHSDAQQDWRRIRADLLF